MAESPAGRYGKRRRREEVAALNIAESDLVAASRRPGEEDMKICPCRYFQLLEEYVMLLLIVAPYGITGNL